MDDPLFGYKHREPHIPTTVKLLEQFGGFDKKRRPLNLKNIALIDKRALAWLRYAGTYAHAIFTAIIYFCPDKDRPIYQKTLYELSEVLMDIRKNNLELKADEENLNQSILAAATAVAHAGNLLNNCVMRFPKKLRRAILEARDLCDEAIRQPGAYKS